jgi:hypothetical protein
METRQEEQKRKSASAEAAQAADGGSEGQLDCLHSASPSGEEGRVGQLDRPFHEPGTVEAASSPRPSPPEEEREKSPPSQVHGQLARHHPASPSGEGKHPVAGQGNGEARTARSAHRSKGKISRFPKEVRDALNEMIEDGLSYGEIIRELGEWGENLSEKNVSIWKLGAHQEWLREQQRLDSCRSGHDLAVDVQREREREGVASFQAPGKIAATLIAEALTDIGKETIQAACKSNPLNLVRMLNSLARLTNGSLKCEQHLALEAERKAKSEKAGSESKATSMSEKERQSIEKKFNLFPAYAYRKRRKKRKTEVRGRRSEVRGQ